MTERTLTYCLTVDEGLDSETRIGHEGPHQVGLGAVFGSDDDRDGRWVLEQAIRLPGCSGEDVDLVRPLLSRPEVKPYFVKVSHDEATALRRVLGAANKHWISAEYADSQDNERLLVLLARTGLVAALGHCLDLQPYPMP